MAEAQRRVALLYFEDGSVEAACPPLQALLHIMAHGHFGGHGIESPEIRGLFRRDVMLRSDWYQERLRIKQRSDMELWCRHVQNLEAARAHADAAEAERLELDARLADARMELKRVQSPEYLDRLVGTLGRDPATH